MERQVEFISDKDQLMSIIFEILKSPVNSRILIAGSFANTMLQDIIDSIIKNNHAGKCRILIPYVFNKGRLPKSQIYEIYHNGGSIRVNSNFTSNLIVIDDNVFIASFSYKIIDDGRQKIEFDNCIFTNCESTAEKIINMFSEIWGKGFPVFIDGIQEEIL